MHGQCFLLCAPHPSLGHSLEQGSSIYLPCILAQTIRIDCPCFSNHAPKNSSHFKQNKVMISSTADLRISQFQRIYLQVQQPWISKGKFRFLPQVPQKFQLETYEVEYVIEGSHGCIYAEPVHGLFLLSMVLLEALTGLNKHSTSTIIIYKAARLH